MKATLDIPDDLYRRVKARSAMEGRPLRSVAIDLFQGWLAGTTSVQASSLPKEPVDENAPWLAVTRKYVRADQNHDLAAMRAAIDQGWTREAEGKLSENAGPA